MTKEELITIITECIECDPSMISFQDRLQEDLMMSSFQMMMFLVKAEEKSGRSVDERLLAKARTVQDLFGLISGTVKE